MKVVLPTQVTAYFWGDNLEQLNWSDHRKYIIQTLLEKGDQTALKWLFKQVKKSELKQLLTTLKLNPKSSNYWQIYLS